MPLITKQDISPSINWDNNQIISSQINVLRRRFRYNHQRQFSNICFENDVLTNMHNEIDLIDFPPIRSVFLRCWENHIFSGPSGQIQFPISRNLSGSGIGYNLNVLNSFNFSNYNSIPLNHRPLENIYNIYYCYILAGFNLIGAIRQSYDCTELLFKADYMLPINRIENFYKINRTQCGGTSQNILTISYISFLKLLHHLQTDDISSFWRLLDFIYDNINRNNFRVTISESDWLIFNSEQNREEERQEDESVNNSELIKDYLSKEDHGPFMSKNQLIELITFNAITKKNLKLILKIIQENSSVTIIRKKTNHIPYSVDITKIYDSIINNSSFNAWGGSDYFNSLNDDDDDGDDSDF